jgi:prepilin-type N-terminal cleavage/methylation domain-containing protein
VEDEKDMKKPVVLRRGFTLIELLVVVMIIVILSGMLFKIAGLVTGKAERAKAIRDIENIQNALNEYYAEYGMYPPTSANRYEFESRTNQPVFLQDYFAANNDPGAGPASFVTDKNSRGVPYSSSIGAVGYEYGLVSYLWERARGDQEHWYDQDVPRDVAAKERWAHYLEDVGLSEGLVPKSFALLESDQPYSNGVAKVVDPWGGEYNYSSTDQCQTYTLWSGGPTGSPDDDIHRNSYSE